MLLVILLSAIYLITRIGTPIEATSTANDNAVFEPSPSWEISETFANSISRLFRSQAIHRYESPAAFIQAHHSYLSMSMKLHESKLRKAQEDHRDETLLTKSASGDEQDADVTKNMRASTSLPESLGRSPRMGFILRLRDD